MTEPYYITTPIYYVNDAPHIGHSYTTIAADVLARFHRGSGRDVRFLTGTDEHGIKMVKAAAEKKVDPKAMADENSEYFKTLWSELNIANDDFIRTTEPRHELRVQKLVQELVDADEIYLGEYEGWYDETQEEYVTETTAAEHDYCSAISGKPLVKYSEENWFFRLTRWLPKLIEHIEANPTFVQPTSRRNEVLSKLKMGVESGELGDLCISRNKKKLPWGVEMPNDPEHVVYVWIDALSNYTNALGIPEIGDDSDGKYANYWPADVHLIGKDILWFHSVYWPCILMARGLPVPKCIFAHGWWTAEGTRMQKTLGNFISRDMIAEYCETYSRDAYRYYLLRAMTFGSDGDFSEEMFKRTYNVDLANGVGNLLSRTVKMISKYFDGVVPESDGLLPEAAPVLAAAEAMITEAPAQMAACQFHRYLDCVHAIVSEANSFIEVTEPFKLAKDESQRDRLASILTTCAEAIRVVLIYLHPMMPEKCTEGLARLGLDVSSPTVDDRVWGKLKAGTVVEPGTPLFMRVP
jgi:methionyl-tRNA synthetase